MVKNIYNKKYEIVDWTERGGKNMKEKTKVKLLALAIMLVTMTLMPIGQVKAALQANPNTQYTKQDYATNWISSFRQMEAAGGAMGLNEKLKGDLTSESSNGIDVHMMRTTEYGAIAILSASGYGNPSNAQAITSTTGNETGVMLNTNNWEWTAGGLQGSIFSGVNSRYFDTYTGNQSSARAGDALGSSTTTNPGADGWHQAARNRWVANKYPYFGRGFEGIFSFGGNYNSDSYYGRGVVVCGAGF